MTPASFSTGNKLRLKRGRKCSANDDNTSDKLLQRKVKLKEAASQIEPLEALKAEAVAHRTRFAKRKRDETSCTTSIKSTKLDAEAAATAELTCGICFDDCLDRGTMDCCDHKFCYSCIKDWLVRSSSCPHCKRQVASLTRSFANGKVKKKVVEKVEKRLLRETLEREEGVNFGRVVLVGQLSYNRPFQTQRVQIDHDHVFNVLLGLRNERASNVQMNPHQSANFYNSQSQNHLHYNFQQNNMNSLSMFNPTMLPVRYASGRVNTRENMVMSNTPRFGSLSRSGHLMGMLPECQFSPGDLSEQLNGSYVPLFPSFNVSSSPQFLSVDPLGTRIPDMVQNSTRVLSPAIDYMPTNADAHPFSAICYPFQHRSFSGRPLHQYRSYETERYSHFQGSTFFNAV